MTVLHLSEKQSQHPKFLLLLALAVCTAKANTKAEIHKEHGAAAEHTPPVLVSTFEFSKVIAFKSLITMLPKPTGLF